MHASPGHPAYPDSPSLLLSLVPLPLQGSSTGSGLLLVLSMLLSSAWICSNNFNYSLQLWASSLGVCSAPGSSSWIDWWNCPLTFFATQTHWFSHVYRIPAHPVTWTCSLNPSQVLGEMVFLLGWSWLFLFEEPISSRCHPFCGVPQKVGDGPQTGEPVSEPSGRWLTRGRWSDFARGAQNVATAGFSMK